MINKPTVEFYSVEHWQENWDELMNRVECGETIGVEKDKGHRAVMTPADEELLEMYVILNNEGS